MSGPAGSTASGSGSAAGRGGGGEPPGIRDQLGAARAAFARLASAHVELARAELEEAMDEIKRISAMAGIAIGALVLAGLIVPIGLSLFLGEWLFGSIGWGVLHGPLFLLGIAVAAVLAALGVSGRRLGIDFLAAAALGIVVGLVLGLELTNRGWSAAGAAIAGNISSDIRPLVVAVGALTVLGGLLGVVAGGRAGGMGGAVAGLIIGAIVGALLGALTAAALGVRVGAAVGTTFALLAWPALMAARIGREGIDIDAVKARLWPDETIETTKETIEWVRARTPLGPKS